MAPNTARIVPSLPMSSPSKGPLLPPSEQTRTKHPHNNDVLCGRGGTINAHPGNEQYRNFVERKKRVYLTARFKREKRLIAQSIVDEIRKLDPPGRFLMKESNGEFWYDVGDEKARDKTSQALRENSMSVRRQMEEEFNETRRQQAREVAIAAGRDPDKAVQDMGAKSATVIPEPPPSGGLQPPISGGGPGLQPRLTGGLQPAQSGFMGRSGYGPLYDAQQPNPPSRSQQARIQQGGLHPPQYEYAHAAPHPYEHPSHSAHYPPPAPYYSQEQQHHPHGVHHYSYPYGHPSQQMMPPPTYDSGIGSNPHYSHHAMPPPARTPSPHVDPQMMHPSHHMVNPPSMMVDPHHPSASHYPDQGARGHPEYHHPQQQHLQQQQHPHQQTPPQQHDPASASRRHSPDESHLYRRVQFQPTESAPLKSEVQGAPQFPPLATNESDIPLVIGAKKRSPTRHPQPRSVPFQSNESMVPPSPPQHPSSPTPNLSPPQARHQDDTLTVSSPKTMQSSAVSHADMSQATPLTFMSNPLSLKTDDSLAKYLEVMEDDIAGDVGQEVELVAHAPMLNRHERAKEHETIVPRHHPRHYHGSGRSAADSNASSSYRGTPPRHRKSSRRRKHRSAGHIPSNSGKVQLDLSAAAFGGMQGEPAQAAQTTQAASTREGPCGSVAVSCGGMLPVPSPIVGRRQQEAVTSPMYPLSPNSLEIEKMSLCGTDNISHGGGSLIGGASLMNVFEDNDSIIGANALMDMSVSLGSGPSSASSLAPNKALGLQPAGQGQAQEQFGDHESLMGASALMDLSVGSHSRSSGSRVYGSSSSSSTKRNRRSLSPASVNKRSDEKVEQAEHQDAAAALHPGPGWTWDGKRRE